jgi:predicted nucleotidyltransferase
MAISVIPVEQSFLDAIIARQLSENAAHEKACAERLQRARDEAKRLAALIGELPDIKRVILFGSAARGSPFTLASDIDLAIEGGDSYAAMAIAETSAFHVDVSDLSLLSPRMRDRVEAEGWVLHEKKS